MFYFILKVTTSKMIQITDGQYKTIDHFPIRPLCTAQLAGEQMKDQQLVSGFRPLLYFLLNHPNIVL